MKAFILIATTLVGFASGLACAHDYKFGALEIDNPWSRAVPKGAAVAAGYMTIKNTGTESDRLLGATTPVAGKVEIHEMTMNNGVMRMRPVPSGIEIKPGQSVELKPESFHLMLTNLKQPIEKDKPFALTLRFEKAGPVNVEFAVEAVGATPAAANAHDTHTMPNMPAGHQH